MFSTPLDQMDRGTEQEPFCLRKSVIRHIPSTVIATRLVLHDNPPKFCDQCHSKHNNKERKKQVYEAKKHSFCGCFPW